MTKTEILDFLAQHKESFSEKYGVTKIGIFGSYARDEAKEKSDIDIFAEMPPKFNLLMKLQDELESQLKHKVDLIRLREKMNPRLKENILREGLYV
jgi:predicted nucleotidyltransferase